VDCEVFIIKSEDLFLFWSNNRPSYSCKPNYQEQNNNYNYCNR